MDILRVENLSKVYGSLTAVDNLSFGIPQGICFGLLGPNGAGKTTTIEMMEGILSPSSGQVLFEGQPIGPKFREKVGIQFQSTALPEFITVKETIELFSAFYPNPRPLAEVIELCSLSDILNRDNQKLSGGQRQRMLLALAVIPRPELVFLDEPTTGLDPQARRHFWDLVNRIKAEGTTILLTTHYMDEAELLCDEIAIMDHGVILERDTPTQLLRQHFAGALVTIPEEAVANPSDLQKLTCCHDLEIRAGHVEIETSDLDGTIRSLLEAKIDLTRLSVHKPDLEDLFLKLTGKFLRS
ncbi:MAG: ABC transporter ATP-binding protein [Spirochaetales bacterium]|nr:ABC transporter ATP-binding protein [Spirochaetales bacterium]